MQNTQLIQVFSSLSAPELRALRKWVNSPFFNQRDDVIALFEYLYALAPYQEGNMPENALEKTVAFRRVFPKQKTYDDRAMRYAMSFLLQQIRRFLVFRAQEANDLEAGLRLCQTLRHRGLDALFDKEYRQQEQETLAQPLRHAAFYLHLYHLKMEQWEVSRRNRQNNSSALLEAGSAHDAYFVAEVLRNACAVWSQPDKPEQQISLFLEFILEKIQQGAFQDQAAVMAFYHCFQLFAGATDTQPAHFQSLKQLLADHWTLFPHNEIRDLYIGAINYGIRSLNRGEKHFIQETLALYRSGLERRVLLEDGQLNKYTYNNVMLLAIGAADWTWAFDFLQTYKEFLPARERENTFRYNLATYYFRKKDYPQAQEILRAVEFRDRFYNLDARRMLVRMYLDTDEITALDSLLDSFNMYLQRKRGTLGYHLDLNRNFIRFVRQIIQLRPQDTRDRQLLLEKIRLTQYVAERDWLLAKCGAI